MIRVNYIYFGFFFLCLAALQLHHLFLIEAGTVTQQLLFAVSSLTQAFLESLFLCLIANSLSLFLSQKISRIFVVSTFFLLLIHCIEFPLIRLMDLTFLFGIDFLMDESWENFLEMLYASNVTINVWLMCGIVVFLLFITGIWICRTTEILSNKKPLVLRWMPTLSLFCLGIGFLCAWDSFSAKHTPFYISQKLERSLPWKTTLISPSCKTIVLPGYLKKDAQREEIFRKLDKCNFTVPKKPDIFLFVIESLREDFLDFATAPHLHSFKKQIASPRLSFSNANATQNSWFSIFNSRYPFYWGKEQKKQENWGAVPLHILKKMGYQIHLYSSSRLSFYQMKDILFGKDGLLLDSFNEYLPDEKTPIWLCDANVISGVNAHLESSSENSGRLFIIFLESTHFDYSWPEEKMTSFSPVIDQINFFKTALFVPHLEPIKNRYRNAIHHVDHLFGKFLHQIKKSAREEPLIVITGDHGEEFFEEGHLFHASNLNELQTRVPIYYNLKGLEDRITSHMDIFPTLLHTIDGEDRFCDFFDGSSLLKPKENPFIVAGRYNASRTPSEFFIHNGKCKLHVQFKEPRNIFKSKELRLLSFERSQNGLSETSSIEEEFGHALHLLFNNSPYSISSSN